MSNGNMQVMGISGREKSKYRDPVVGVWDDSKDMGHSASEGKREMS